MSDDPTNSSPSAADAEAGGGANVPAPLSPGRVAGSASDDQHADAVDDAAGDDIDEHDDTPMIESVTEPAKVMRIGSMVKQLLEEVRAANLDEASRERLAEVYERSIVELSGALSEDLQEELRNLALPFDHDEVPSDAELRVAKAQLVGWLEGLFHGIQASLMAQQFAAQQQLQQMRELPSQGESSGGGGPARPVPPQTGTYL